jgi:hypothetical protein
MTFRVSGKQRPKFSAYELNRLNESADRVFTKTSLIEGRLIEDPQSLWVWIKNTSGSDRARFDCMALGDPEFGLELDGSVDLIFQGTASALDKSPVILIDDIANGEFGKGVIHGLALARVGSGSVNNRWAIPGTHKLTPGNGSIKLLAAPSASEDKLLPVLLGVDGGLLMQTPSGGIAARSGTTISSAVCTVWTRSGSTISATSQTESVFNLSTSAVGGTKYIIAKDTNIGKVAVWEDC